MFLPSNILNKSPIIYFFIRFRNSPAVYTLVAPKCTSCLNAFWRLHVMVFHAHTPDKGKKIKSSKISLICKSESHWPIFERSHLLLYCRRENYNGKEEILLLWISKKKRFFTGKKKLYRFSYTILLFILIQHSVINLW